MSSPPVPAVQVATTALKKGKPKVAGVAVIVLGVGLGLVIVAAVYLMLRIKKQDERIALLKAQQEQAVQDTDVQQIIRHYMTNGEGRALVTHQTANLTSQWLTEHQRRSGQPQQSKTATPRQPSPVAETVPPSQPATSVKSDKPVDTKSPKLET